ncbi:YidC/Oxa1 family membrane protein insertase [Streptomyces acidiscabies]|uniref:YidC/Oxa1 family membrane protein insertase n=1 Tax=Streptomyces acidiscabies TaxID=42234 RepID=UPI0038F6268B
MSVFASLVERFAALLEPLFHASAAAAAIILLTALVRLLVHPLSRASARGQKARAALQPKIADLREKHGKDPERLQKAVLELHAKEQVSPLAGCLPSLIQLPVFFVLFHLFSRPTIGGETNGLLEHELLAAPLGKRWTDALGDGGLFGPAGLVYLGLFALVAVVAWFSYRQTRRTMSTSAPAATGSEVPGLGAVTRVMPYLSFFTLVSVAVVPLAAALYIVTSTAWGTAERTLLHR